MGRYWAVLLIVLAIAWPTGAFAEKRVALVFSAERYEHLRVLQNPGNDADKVGEALEKLGFEVIAESNRNLRRMRQALDNFREDAKGADVALMFFAGHGVEIGGRNYLLPVDADPASLDTLEKSALPLEEVRAAAAAVAKSVLLVLDACRNDPFGEVAAEGRSMNTFGGQPRPASIKPGLGRIGHAENTLVAFSAAPGQTAADGEGDNSPFSAALAQYLGTEGLEIRSVLTIVGQDVYTQTGGKQQPYVESGLPNLFFAGETGELPERERLLLAMADVTPDMRAEVERVAAANEMPLAPLYGALISADLKAMTFEDRDKKLTEAAHAFVSTRDNLKRLSSTDPGVTRLRSEAELALSLGAFARANHALEAAAKLDATSSDALAANLVTRRLSEADTHQARAGVAMAQLDYDGAIAAYEQAAALHEKIEKEDVPDKWRSIRVSILAEIGDNHVRVGATGPALEAYRRMESAARLAVSVDPGNPDFRQNLGVSLQRLGDAVLANGDLDGAQRIYREYQAIVHRLVNDFPDNDIYRRDQALVEEKLGKAFVRSGNLAQALAHYKTSLEIRRDIAKDESPASEISRELWASLALVGETQLATGDLASARATFAEAVANSREAIAQDAGDGDWNRQLALTLLYLGDAEKLQGAVPSALNSYEEARSVLQQLVEADPRFVEWRRDFLMANQRVGDLQRQIGDFDGAAESAETALNLNNQMVAMDLANLTWRHDRVIALAKLGDARLAQGRLFDAARSYDNATKAAKELVAINPQRLDWLGIQAVTLNKVGDVAAKMVGGRDPLELYEQSLAIVRRMAKADPVNAEWKRSVWVGTLKTGEVMALRGDCAAALPRFLEGLAIIEELVARDPSNVQWRRDLAVSLGSAAHCGHERRASLERALAIVTELQQNGALSAADAAMPEVYGEALNDLR